MFRAIEYSFCAFESGDNNFLLIDRKPTIFRVSLRNLRDRQTYKHTIDVGYATTDAMGIRVERRRVVDYRK